MRRAVFLDKDGTLIEDVPYSLHLRFRPGAFKALRQLRDFALVVVTNQSGVARGLLTMADLDRLYRDMKHTLAQERIPLAGFYACPHGPQDGCSCRKPEPGMLLQAARDLDLDLAHSWMVGDRDSDLEAGKRAGCRSIRAGDMQEVARRITHAG